MNSKNVKIGKYDLEGNLLEVTQGSYVDVSKYFNVNYNGLLDNIKGRVNTCENFQFVLINDITRPKIASVYHLETSKSKGAVIKKYKGKVICVYNTLKEASVKNRIGENLIVNAIKNKGITNTFSFEWLEKK